MSQSRCSLIWKWSCGLAVLFVSCTLALGDSIYTFTRYDFPDANDTTIHDINDSGAFVGEFGDISPAREQNPGMKGYLNDDGVLRELSFPNSTQTSAQGINNLGIVVGNYVDAQENSHGFIFDGNEYVAIDYPGAVRTELSDINDDGLMVGAYSDLRGLLHAFSFDGATYVSFDFGSAPIATAFGGVNNDGASVGTSTELKSLFPLVVDVIGFISPGDAVISVPNSVGGDLGVAGTFAEGVSNSGEIVGRYFAVLGEAAEGVAEVELRGYVFDPSTSSYVRIDLPGGSCPFELEVDASEVAGPCYRSLQSINTAQDIVGYYDEGDENYHGFIGTLTSEIILGDFDRDGNLSEADIDSLTTVIIAGSNDPRFDLDDDELVNEADHETWVVDLKGTYVGDANLDGEFNSSDMVQVFVGGKYETSEAAGWAEGDWTADGLFDSGDMVAAFVDGGYEQGQRMTVAVPEGSISGLVLVVIGLVGTLRRRGRLAFC